MKLKRSVVEWAAILAVYLLALYLYTLPLHNNNLPFGDVDASSHFVVGDYMVQEDQSTARVPASVFHRYGGQNADNPGYLWYPPQYWTNTAIAQIFGGERILPVYLFIALASTLIVLSSFFFVRHAFGFWPAFLASTLLVFSTRDYMIYLWGQWPQALSFGFTPLVLYCFYTYIKSVREQSPKPLYVYLVGFFVAAQYFFHPQGLVASCGACLIYLGLSTWKHKKLVFNIKHGLIAVVVMIAVAGMFAPLNLKHFVNELSSGEDGPTQLRFDLLFKWYQGITGNPGLPDFYFSYPFSHGGLANGDTQARPPNPDLIAWWTLPFLLIGLVVLVMRRREQDLMLLSWFVSFYLLTRLTVIGMGARDIRMFAYEAHVFYPIIAIGALALVSFAPSAFKSHAKIGVIGLMLGAIFLINAPSMIQILEQQQNSIAKINSAQLEVSEWIQTTLPDEVVVRNIGSLGFNYYGSKVKWMGVLSQHTFVTKEAMLNLSTHIMFDYTDALAMQNQQYIQSIQQAEAQLGNSTPIYNKNEIRVYKLA